MPEPTEKPEKSDNIPPLRRLRLNPRMTTSIWWILGALLLVAIVIYAQNSNSRSEIDYGFFRQQLTKKTIASVNIEGDKIYGEFVKDKVPLDPNAKADSAGAIPRLNQKFVTVLPALALNDQDLNKLLLEQLKPENYKASEPPDNSFVVLFIYVLVFGGLFIAATFLFRRARDSFFSGGLTGSFSKSGARRYDASAKSITFADVAGLEGVKHDLQEIVDFLRNPAKFQRLGARVPKGVLLMGPPGTGKTLLGRAVAGEAGVPFFSINGSEFIQMFVGVGAGRVRDLFDTAKTNAPAILFIDEIDAVGRHRGAGVGGGHDEREQTLNQILSEMDGFTQTESVIVMAATNRPDVLDPALLRPGRFDRHITVDRPTFKGRLAIFQVHSKNVPLGDDVDMERLAAGTVGLTGADISNLVNEAALWASRNNKDQVDMADFEYARDKLLMGSKREEILSDEEKKMTAYHESGHALLAWLVPGTDRVHKVSVVPRGRSLGATQLLPQEDRVSVSESELHNRLIVALGGRSAEKMVFNEYSAGAESDLDRATQLARRMVTYWGMSERLGPVAFRDSEDHPFLGREMAEPRRFSEHTAQVIDEEVSRILRDASEKATTMLKERRDMLDMLAHKLEEAETLDEEEIEKLIGPPVYKRPARSQ
jgi:cell division protease FtsH